MVVIEQFRHKVAPRRERVVCCTFIYRTLTIRIQGDVDNVKERLKEMREERGPSPRISVSSPCSRLMHECPLF